MLFKVAKWNPHLSPILLTLHVNAATEIQSTNNNGNVAKMNVMVSMFLYFLKINPWIYFLLGKQAKLAAIV